MKNLINQFKVIFSENDEFKRRLSNYERALKTEEWQFLRDSLLMMRAQILTDMLSRQHTLLSETEKDVVQRTYYNINQMIAFLLEPSKWVKKADRWKQPDLTARKVRVKKENKNG